MLSASLTADLMSVSSLTFSCVAALRCLASLFLVPFCFRYILSSRLNRSRLHQSLSTNSKLSLLPCDLVGVFSAVCSLPSARRPLLSSNQLCRSLSLHPLSWLSVAIFSILSPVARAPAHGLPAALELNLLLNRQQRSAILSNRDPHAVSI